MNKEEVKNVISMDMGGTIEPVELPTPEEETVEEVERSSVVPELMQINPTNTEVPSIVENPTEVSKPTPTPTIEEVKKPEPVILEVPKTTPVEEPKPAPMPAPVEVPKPTPMPAPVEVPKPTPMVVTEEIKTTPVVIPVPPTPTIGEVKKEPLNIINSKTTSTPTVNKELEKTIVVSAPISEQKDDKPLETTGVKVEEEVKDEEKETKEVGPNVISEPLAKEDTGKEKKKNPHFFECPPDCIPIKPFGYIFLTIIYSIPIIGLIVILAHSASYKNLNRRNYARSWLIGIILIILIIFALIYFLKVDFIGIIENITGYKIDLQHFKFIKFK